MLSRAVVVFATVIDPFSKSAWQLILHHYDIYYLAEDILIALLHHAGALTVYMYL